MDTSGGTGNGSSAVVRGGRRAVITLVMLALMSPGWASEIQSMEGVVAQVQLIEVSTPDGDSLLIVSLEEGASFLLPDQATLAASAGVKVAIRFLPPASSGDLPEACSVHVLGLPVRVDGEEKLQRAQRPFEVYRNRAQDCH